MANEIMEESLLQLFQQGFNPDGLQPGWYAATGISKETLGFAEIKFLHKIYGAGIDGYRLQQDELSLVSTDIFVEGIAIVSDNTCYISKSRLGQIHLGEFTPIKSKTESLSRRSYQ